MIKQKFLNLVLSILVVASLLFGGINKVNAQEPDPTVPQGQGQDPALPEDATLTNRVTPAERQAAADRNTALGLLPGLAKPQPVVRTNGRGVAAPDPSVVPHYFGPFANYANSPLPMGSIASITVENGGTGYSATPTVIIYDVYGTGMDATATATVVGGVITGITVNTGGFDYSAPIVVIDDTAGTGAAATPVLGSLTGGIRKFVDSLPGLTPAGINNLDNFIPVGVPDTITYGDSFNAQYPADYYEIALVEFTQQLHSDLPPTTIRGYVQLETPALAAKLLLADSNYLHVQLFYLDGSPIQYADGSFVYAVDKPRYFGPTIVSEKDKPVRIKFYNFLPTTAEGGDLFIPVDESVMGAGEGNLTPDGLSACNRDLVGGPECAKYSQNRATLHLHGGLVPWISDGTPHQWITPAGENSVYPKGASVEYVPDMWFDSNGNIVSAGTLGASNNPGDGAMTFYYNNQQSARLQFYHDHAYGITRLNVYAGEAAGYLITDEIEKDLIDGTNVTGVNPNAFVMPGGLGIPLVLQDKTFVDATTIAAQDPTWRWGTGEIVNGRRVPKTGDLWLPSVYMPIQNPWDPAAGANAFGRWQYGPWFWPPTANVLHGPIANEYYDPGCDPALTWCEPPMRNDSPNPSMGMEAYMDTSLVNGAVYPFLEVDPKAYRFRVLNAANDRFYNLSMFVAVDANGVECDVNTNPTPAPEASGVACTEVKMVPALLTDPTNSGFPGTWPNDAREGGAPDYNMSGPDWVQIGTEGGFLPAPAVIPAQPVTWVMNPGFFNVGTVEFKSLLLGNAERADVIVDFSQFAGKTIIVYNDAPTAFPALDPRYDYYTGNPSQMDSGGAPTTQAGYGPNTRTVMQIKVANTAPAAPFDVDALNAVFAKGPAPEKRGVFERGQEPIIVPQAVYNSAYNASFPADASQFVKIHDTSMTFTPMGSTTPVTISFQEKAIHDEMGDTYDQEYGRMSGHLGIEIPGTTALTQNIVTYGYASPPVDFLAASPGIAQLGTLADGTTLWKITHNGVDTHPIHIHLANAQLINRVGWDGLILPPDANELGWKETIRIDPLESTIWAVRPVLPTQPFDIPNSERLIDPTLPDGAQLMGPPGGFKDPNLNGVTVLNHVINYGWEYVWHCHILSHEEMDMMHSLVFAVKPNAPTGLTASGTDGTVNLQWVDNSANETNWTIQRSTDGITWTNIIVPSSTGAAAGGTVSYPDAGLTPGALYMHRVMATNTVGDTFAYAGGGSFPTVTQDSVPSNTVANMVGVTSIVRASADPTNAADVNFTVTFSEAVSGVDTADFTLAGTATSGASIASVTLVSGSVYTVTVNTGVSGTLGLDVIGGTTTPALSSNFTTGELYTVDKEAPVVVSVVRAAGAINPSKLTGVNFTVTFDRAVTGVDIADFSTVPSGLTGTSVMSVAGSGTTYTVTALTGTGVGTLGLDVVADGTILGSTGNALAAGYTTSELYDIDKVSPTISSMVLASAAPISTPSVDFTVIFSEAVTGVDKGDFDLTTTGVTGASVTSVTGVGPSTTYTVTVNTGTGDDGTLRLNLRDNNSILDAVGNPFGGTTINHYVTGLTYSITKPLMPLSSIRLNSSPTNRATVYFQVTFSKSVNGVDLADFSLTNSLGINGASIVSVTGTGTTRNVGVATGLGDGTIQLNVIDNDTIVDSAGNLLGGPGLGNGDFTTGLAYTIDKTGPTVLSSVRLNASPTNRTTVFFSVTFSEAVTAVDAADFSLTASGVSGSSIISVTGTGSTRVVAVGTGTGNGTILLNVADNDTIIDGVGIPLGGTGTGNGNYTIGQSYTVDKTVPTVVSINRANATPTNRTTAFYTVTFSESVTGVDLADFVLTNTGTFSVAPTVTSVTGTGTTRTVGVSTGTGTGTGVLTTHLDLNDNDSILDLAGNPVGGAGAQNFTTGQVYTIDKTVPSVVSIVRLNPNPTTRTVVYYTVTFSEAVTGVNAGDFRVTTVSGTITGTSIASVTGSGTTYNVGVNTGTLSGVIRLDVLDDDSIRDSATNRLGGTGTTGAGDGSFTTGDVYNVR